MYIYLDSVIGIGIFLPNPHLMKELGPKLESNHRVCYI